MFHLLLFYTSDRSRHFLPLFAKFVFDIVAFFHYIDGWQAVFIYQAQGFSFKSAFSASSSKDNSRANSCQISAADPNALLLLIR